MGESGGGAGQGQAKFYLSYDGLTSPTFSELLTANRIELQNRKLSTFKLLF